MRVRRKGKDRTMRFDAKEFGGRISIIMDENVWNKMKDTGAYNLSPESWNKPSGGIFAFHYLFRRGKPWYTGRNESKVINLEVPL